MSENKFRAGVNEKSFIHRDLERGRTSPGYREDIGCPEIKADTHFLASEFAAVTPLPPKQDVGSIQVRLKNAALLLVALENTIQVIYEFRHDIGLLVKTGAACSRQSGV